jgi:CBS domain-containing protein
VVGQALAVLFIAGGVAVSVLSASDQVEGLWTQGLWMMVVGAFLFSMALASHRQAGMRETLQRLTAAEVMSTGVPMAPGDVSLRRLMEDYIAPSGQGFSLISLAGRVSGLISIEHMGRVPKTDWDLCRASDLMVPLGLTEAVTPDLDAYSVMELLEAKGTEHVLVMEAGVLLGTITKDSFRPYSSAPRGSHKRARA